MKKVIYALIFSLLVFNVSNYKVKAEEFDYNKCMLDCSTAGDKKACNASCEVRKNASDDAKKFIEEKKELCNGDASCERKWENAYSIKFDYFLDYYTGFSSEYGEFNYSTFDYDNCWFNCQSSGEYSKYCKSNCQAREEVQMCILDAVTAEGVKACKKKYDTFYQEKLEENGVVTPEEDDGPIVDEKYKEMMQYCNKTCSKTCEKDQTNTCSRYCYQDCMKNYGKTYAKIQCGDSEVPYIIPQIVRTIILILQIAAPLIIIIIGSLDFVKAIIAQKDDEIKKGKDTFLRRLLLGASVFLVFFIVEIIIGIVAPKDDNDSMWKCVDCFVNGDCEKKW